jgi:hypothetical protein
MAAELALLGEAQLAMRTVRLRAAVLAGTLLLGGCFGSEHPNPQRYEYLYIDGAFQPPFTDFPAGTERANWKCYDHRSERTFDCTFVRGGWDYYRYIYRVRT